MNYFSVASGKTNYITKSPNLQSKNKISPKALKKEMGKKTQNLQKVILNQLSGEANPERGIGSPYKK